MSAFPFSSPQCPPCSPWLIPIPNNVYYIISLRATAQDLRLSVEQALRYRRPRAVIIDEAQHLTKISSGRRLQEQMDVLKSLANQTGSLLVLIGTYELLTSRA